MRKPLRCGVSGVSSLYGKVGAVITQQRPGVVDELFEDVKPKLRAVQVEVRCAG